MNDLKSKSINKEVEAVVDKNTIVLSDAYNGYNNLEELLKNIISLIYLI